LLLEAALNEIKEDDSVLELGTGNGIIAEALSKRLILGRFTDVDRCPSQNRPIVIATDINPYAVRCARSKGVDVIRTYLFRGLRGRFDLILFNPPYLPIESGEIEDRWLEASWDGGRDGRRVINQFLGEVGGYLSKKGRFLLVVSSLSGSDRFCEANDGRFPEGKSDSSKVNRQGIDDTINLAGENGFKVEILEEEKLFFERLVVIKGSLAR
jgi:release factor glutamine methyltransferase